MSLILSDPKSGKTGTVVYANTKYGVVERRLTIPRDPQVDGQMIIRGNFALVTRRNIIAAEIEKVIDALASQSFSRADFLQKLDRFYFAMEQAAATTSDFSQTRRSASGTYSTTSMPCCITRSIGSATPPTSAANCRGFPS